MPQGEEGGATMSQTTKSVLAAASVVFAMTLGRLVPGAGAAGAPPERVASITHPSRSAVSPSRTARQDDDTGDDGGDDGDGDDS
jgi:hypothetical protein